MRLHDDTSRGQQGTPAAGEVPDGVHDDSSAMVFFWLPPQDDGTMEVEGDSGGPLFDTDFVERLMFRCVIGAGLAYILCYTFYWTFIDPPTVGFVESMRITAAGLLRWL